MDIIWHKQIVCFLITTKHFPWFLPHWLTPRTKGRANFWRAQKQTWPPHESAKTPADRLWRLEKIIRNVVCVFMSWRQSSKWAAGEVKTKRLVLGQHKASRGQQRAENQYLILQANICARGGEPWEEALSAHIILNSKTGETIVSRAF